MSRIDQITTNLANQAYVEPKAQADIAVLLMYVTEAERMAKYYLSEEARDDDIPSQTAQEYLELLGGADDV